MSAPVDMPERATAVARVGAPFRARNTNGKRREWQRVRLTYPDDAVLVMDIDLMWPHSLDESVEHYALRTSDWHRHIGWAYPEASV